jgi:hypothetical protein
MGTRRRTVPLLALLSVVADACASTSSLPSPSPPPRPIDFGPVGPQPTITCRPDAVEITPGTDIQAMVNRFPAGTTFCILAGTHYPATPIVPKSSDTLTGEFGAIIDGGQVVLGTYDGIIWGKENNVTNVTIRNLVVRNLPGLNQSGNINKCINNKGSSAGWVIDHNELTACQGGIAGADSAVITSNRIHDNIQYGFGGNNSTGVTIQNNEIDHNDVCRCYPGDGAASKLVYTTNYSVIGNYFHDNGNHDVWFDTGNTGVLIDGNTMTMTGLFDKPVLMEANDGTAIIRNNTITISSNAQVGIQVNNSSNEQIYNNTITNASTLGGAIGIHIFYNAARIGSDTTNNSIHDNMVTLQQSTAIIAQVSCSGVNDCSPYWTSKGNTFTGNTYDVPNQTGRYWNLQTAVTWAQWTAIGFDE